MQKRSLKFWEECTPFDRTGSLIALNTKIRLGRRISELSAAEPHYNPRTTRQDHEPSIVTFERFDERLRIPFDLRYSFDIKRGAVTQEVGVDAQTVKVLENKKEAPHPDQQS